jgi:predicted ATPase
MSVRVHIENFRCLRKADVELQDGASVLIGPNGAGKSTFLAALQFMSNFLISGPGQAVENQGGGGQIKSFDASDADEVVLEAETGGARWKARPRLTASGVTLPVEEQFYVNDKLLIEQDPGNAQVTILEKRYDKSGEAAKESALGQVLQLQSVLGQALVSNVFRLKDVLFFQPFSDPDLSRLRTTGSTLGTETHLFRRGENLFNVLRNWQAGDLRLRKKIDSIREALREAFPDLFHEMDFEVAGQTVSARFYMPGRSEPVPIARAPNGLLAGMLHLAAVHTYRSSSNVQGTIAIDEFENSLHPHAIRSLANSISSVAAEAKIPVVFASHSPVLLDCFKDTPQRIFVFQSGQSPTRLDKLNDPDWLAQFSLGDLYANEDIAAPNASGNGKPELRAADSKP